MKRISIILLISGMFFALVVPSHALFDDKIDKAYELFRIERHEDALRLLDEAILDDPTNPKTHFRVGQAYLIMGRDHEAKNIFSVLVRKLDKSYGVKVGKLYFERGDWQQAVEFDQSLAKTPPRKGVAILQDVDKSRLVFSFSGGGKVKVPIDPNVKMEFDFLVDIPHGLATNNQTISNDFSGLGGIIDLGAVPMEKVSEAPQTGYQPTLKLSEIVVGHTYCILASDAKHYGKIHVVRFDSDKDNGFLEFMWQYQPDGTRELKTR